MSAIKRRELSLEELYVVVAFLRWVGGWSLLRSLWKIRVLHWCDDRLEEWARR